MVIYFYRLKNKTIYKKSQPKIVYIDIKKLSKEEMLMKNVGNVKKVCSFCVSDWHFITMITPYINQKIKNNEKILLYSSQNYTQLIKTFLPKLMIDNEKKQKIEKLNWHESNIEQYSKIAETLSNIKENEVTLIIKGDNLYIENVNNLIEQWTKKNTSKKITIVNCYEVGEFNQNIKQILKEHHKILNTSGEKEISDVFEGVS